MSDRVPFLQLRPHYTHDGLRLLNIYVVPEEPDDAAPIGQLPAMGVETKSPADDITKQTVTIGGHRVQRATYADPPEPRRA